MKEVHYLKHASAFTEQMSVKGGVLVVCGRERNNIITIGWGGINYYWGRPMIVVPVRYSRHSYKLLENCPDFTVNISFGGLGSQLVYCGTHSGRDVDKFDQAGLTRQDALKVDVPAIKEAQVVYECRTIYRQTLDQSAWTDTDARERGYIAGDFHTLFYGEILACYENA